MTDVNMSNYGASEDGTEEKPGFTLTKAVEDVSQQGFAQSVSLAEKQRTLSSLQAALLDVETKVETAEQELRCKVRGILVLEAETEHLEQQTRALHGRCASVTAEITELRFGIREGEEDAQRAMEEFTAYRDKMKSHREAALRSARQTEAHRVLEEKRGQVGRLTQKREELREDLESPNGNTVQTAKREMTAVKAEISETRRTIATRREQLRKEIETHAHVKKDIEIQNRRYEAIVKRLHCQLSRAQAVHRQMSEDIYHMGRELEELKRQLESSQDSAVSGQ